MDDEHGVSEFARLATKRMAEPLPEKWQNVEWNMVGEFHMCSDLPLIPPYYREEHEPNCTFTDNTIHTYTTG